MSFCEMYIFFPDDTKGLISKKLFVHFYMDFWTYDVQRAFIIEGYFFLKLSDETEYGTFYLVQSLYLQITLCSSILCFVGPFIL